MSAEQGRDSRSRAVDLQVGDQPSTTKVLPETCIENSAVFGANAPPCSAAATETVSCAPTTSAHGSGGAPIEIPGYEILGELGRVSAELKDIELPAKCGDAEKAEMLLGYLARSEKDKHTDTEPKSSTPEGVSA